MASGPLGRALELVKAKRFDDAAAFLRSEISKDEFGPGETSDLCGLLGGVLSEIGRIDEAEAAHREAVRRAIANCRDDIRTAQVSVARYFLAAHLLDRGNTDDALAEVEAALREEAWGHDTLHALAAEILQEMGRDNDARIAAAEAIRAASSDKMRVALLKRLGALLPGAGDAG